MRNVKVKLSSPNTYVKHVQLIIFMPFSQQQTGGELLRDGPPGCVREDPGSDRDDRQRQDRREGQPAIPGPRPERARQDRRVLLDAGGWAAGHSDAEAAQGQTVGLGLRRARRVGPGDRSGGATTTVAGAVSGGEPRVRLLRGHVQRAGARPLNLHGRGQIYVRDGGPLGRRVAMRGGEGENSFIAPTSEEREIKKGRIRRRRAENSRTR
mmetsp:Transcript_10401/g.25472  ORF Transcript_10401/g.25472 Transcript_10401/m.25472 type:complete len:210 (+) Transcript_10401:251-880(+)